MWLLREAINCSLYLGLKEYEGHFALYPEGAVYQKHIDQFKTGPGNQERLISVIFYLNEDWGDDQGGELVLYNPYDHQKILETITPKLGRLACFLTENLPHEVLMATRPRYSLTGWLRR
jgi:SM-20-related protein